MKSPLPQSTYRRNAEIYKAMANSKRLEILNTLARSERSVEELTSVLRVPKANVSQHLALLRHMRLVTSRRNGTKVFYKIRDPRIVASCKILHDLWRVRTFV